MFYVRKRCSSDSQSLLNPTINTVETNLFREFRIYWIIIISLSLSPLSSPPLSLPLPLLTIIITIEWSINHRVYHVGQYFSLIGIHEILWNIDYNNKNKRVTPDRFSNIVSTYYFKQYNDYMHVAFPYLIIIIKLTYYFRVISYFFL